METLIKLAYLIFISVIISFFVALLIKGIMWVIKLINISKERTKEGHYFSSQNVEKIQQEAGNTDKELEIQAVIGLAISMYLEEHENIENFRLTINKIIKPYSPWSSKIYGLRKYPRIG